MNVDSIQAEHWSRMSTLTLPTAQMLRKKWTALNSVMPHGYEKPLSPGTLKPGIDLVEQQVSSTFYSKIYSKMTAGLQYALNLPGEPDANWEQLVALWKGMEKINTQQIAEPGSDARWVTEARKKCRRCTKDFGILTRPHHCRLCGEVFCENCTKKRMDVNNPLDAGQSGRVRGLQKDQRVCDDCYAYRTTLRTHAAVQQSGNDVEGARLWESYTSSNKPVLSRFQFVVTEGGGVVLLSRLNRAFQMYFHDHPRAREAFNGWKIFGERAGRGRSDSCVVYLLVTHKDERVSRLWNGYVLANSDLKRSIATSFIAPGLFPMGNGAWAIDLPDEADERRVLKKVCGGSAGGLIADVLGAGFARAAVALHDKPDEPLTMEHLRNEAKGIVRDLVSSLYHAESNRRQNRLGGISQRLQNRMGTRLG